ncbi:uncharacterized protein SPPG_04936 [Spizellomyces punctatus DAOM BR117]|uniref:NodB homology domain-containing protein n=1 Tax=Spizellomyces punctatus (strain DAOM BR117) TaxID=645134 RepID=A0A0L0HEM6_SPIPD|nr:uncharacterized protein SPPG_04936 [Spizellomyces punctatus DAOM BR117]KNC99547.1 hypothetical protein SPPG_04936 [Spizellomyces punctatus DAOM BR117]|eukprot:XP_016607587.1 hypothetical protein SPPG_04936 [Spizellomyces punctatus DAOM BR117]
MMTPSWSYTLPIATLFLLNGARAALQLPPPMPKAWPALDQTVMIDGALLQDPLVTEALAHVQTVVPASILNLKPSTYISGSTVTYLEDSAATCYWPANQCTRGTNANFKPDIVTCPSANTWGITYDDGPTVNLVNGAHKSDTGEIRTTLDKMGLKATFFVCGTGVRTYPSEVKASYDSGHQIASHTWTHHPLTSLTNAQIVAELKYTEAAIYQAIGQVPTHFRPPYGDIDDRVRAIVDALGYRTVLWTTNPVRDSEDASVTPSTAAGTQVLNTVKTWGVAQPGFISLEHDITTFTSSVAVDVLNWVASVGASFPLKIQPINQCIGESGYWAAAASTTSTSSSSTLTSSGSTKTTTATATGTTSGKPAPTATATAPAEQQKSSAGSIRNYVSELFLGALVALGVQLF